tara:strand:+ start:68 stop:367 length:300 start_codon:yes stop_codon:yes gene_type:complete
MTNDNLWLSYITPIERKPHKRLIICRWFNPCFHNGVSSFIEQKSWGGPNWALKGPPRVHHDMLGSTVHTENFHVNTKSETTTTSSYLPIGAEIWYMRCW